ncbi:hypothetical protein RJT34_03453 [Clitoria ternatea]|uniref:Uncharacterized protein n=1 Tax=Clitoria ternatea TaxID=43366 RepID=A0AAN9KLP0_CLITE
MKDHIGALNANEVHKRIICSVDVSSFVRAAHVQFIFCSALCTNLVLQLLEGSRRLAFSGSGCLRCIRVLRAARKQKTKEEE